MISALRRARTRSLEKTAASATLAQGPRLLNALPLAAQGERDVHVADEAPCLRLNDLAVADEKDQRRRETHAVTVRRTASSASSTAPPRTSPVIPLSRRAMTLRKGHGHQRGHGHGQRSRRARGTPADTRAATPKARGPANGRRPRRKSTPWPSGRAGGNSPASTDRDGATHDRRNEQNPPALRRRDLGQGPHVQQQNEDEPHSSEGPDPAVPHDGQSMLGVMAGQAVQTVGQAVQVKASGEQFPGDDRNQPRQQRREDPSCGPLHENQDSPDTETDEREPRCRRPERSRGSRAWCPAPVRPGHDREKPDRVHEAIHRRRC